MKYPEKKYPKHIIKRYYLILLLYMTADTYQY